MKYTHSCKLIALGTIGIFLLFSPSSRENKPTESANPQQGVALASEPVTKAAASMQKDVPHGVILVRGEVPRVDRLCECEVQCPGVDDKDWHWLIHARLLEVGGKHPREVWNSDTPGVYASPAFHRGEDLLTCGVNAYLDVKTGAGVDDRAYAQQYSFRVNRVSASADHLRFEVEAVSLPLHEVTTKDGKTIDDLTGKETTFQRLGNPDPTNVNREVYTGVMLSTATPSEIARVSRLPEAHYSKATLNMNAQDDHKYFYKDEPKN